MIEQIQNLKCQPYRHSHGSLGLLALLAVWVQWHQHGIRSRLDRNKPEMHRNDLDKSTARFDDFGFNWSIIDKTLEPKQVTHVHTMSRMVLVLLHSRDVMALVCREDWRTPKTLLQSAAPAWNTSQTLILNQTGVAESQTMENPLGLLCNEFTSLGVDWVVYRPRRGSKKPKAGGVRVHFESNNLPVFKQHLNFEFWPLQVWDTLLNTVHYSISYIYMVQRWVAPPQPMVYPPLWCGWWWWWCWWGKFY